ncbi:MAG: uroporphyrinogen-III synthase, partial [Pseudolabrys sp.]|nr:uroporphyrinogen-III synthase [Pseudolabrys sp.]
MQIVVTRPLPDGARTAATLRARGHDVIVAPLMRVETLAADLSGTWSGVVATSANALRALDAAQALELSNLPVFVVGRRTGEAAQEVGFTDVISADGDGGDLAELIAARCAHAKLGTPAPLLYLAGEDRAFDLEGELRGMGIAAKTVTIYRAVTAPFPEELTAALRAKTVDAVLHFSRRSAENYVADAIAAATDAALSPRHFCL